MSLPDKIWAADGYINGVFGGFWSPDEDADETPYLRLDGPTLQAVREALRGAIERMWEDAVVIDGEWGSCREQEELEKARETPAAIIATSAALKLLEGE